MHASKDENFLDIQHCNSENSLWSGPTLAMHGDKYPISWKLSL